ncbi:carbohydrate ABC transporter permease [Fundicoccus sp. Sow4_H7]|uniref:carbohydrate ABC transporter permease n=1 Tax=Fundicoccus sp. Sow4_H7 TaxID=3438784 RepID=UPI003F93BFE1
MKKKKLSIWRILTYAVLILAALAWSYPILWGIFTSFKSEAEIRQLGYSFLPINWTIENYQEILFENPSTPILSWFTNSLIVAVGHVALVLVVTSLAAYGYARMDFKGKDVLFSFLLASMMFPGIVNLIPLYDIVQQLGWLNNKLALIVPGAGSVGNVFLVRQFALNIPKSFDESARIDGANDFQIFTSIILPILKPVLIVTALFSFTGSWNDFLWPSIVMSGLDDLTITPGLQLLQGQYRTYPGLGAAGAVMAIIPTVLLYVFAQKYFMESLTLEAGLKG